MDASLPTSSSLLQSHLADLERAASFVRRTSPVPPRIGVVLGSGLGAFAEMLDQHIPYADIPSMPVPAVSGHAGRLSVGELSGVRVACLSGRVHLYEGHDPLHVVFGVRLLTALGCEEVLLTNAAGGIQQNFSAGDSMLITDHLNLTGKSPLTGANVDHLGPRFPDMSALYDKELGKLAHAAGRLAGVALREGVYAGVVGPSYETPAEIRMLRTLGADAVGMSTVLEAIALRHAGVRVGAISCITNLAAGLSSSPLQHREVELMAKSRSVAFVELLTRWIALIGSEADLPAPSLKGGRF